MALLSFSSNLPSLSLAFQFFNPKPKPPFLIVRCKDKKEKYPKMMKLVSTANTGFFYVTMLTKGMEGSFDGEFKVRKYDPRVKRHVPFNLKKIK